MPSNTKSTGHTHNYRRTRRVTTPILSSAHREVVTIKIEGELRHEPMPNLAKNADGTVPILPVIDLSDGTEALYIVPAVFKGVLERTPDYVGKCFEILRGEQREGKSYTDLEVYEIEENE